MPGRRPDSRSAWSHSSRDGVEVQQVGRRLRHERRPPCGPAAPSSCGGSCAGDRRRRRRSRRPDALQRPQQRRLAGAVAAHQRDDLARPRGRGRRRATATTVAVAHDDAARPQRRSGGASAPGRARRGRGGRGGSRCPQRRRPCRRASRTDSGSGVPAGEPAELDDRRRERRRPSIGAAGHRDRPCRRRRTSDDPVGVLHAPVRAGARPAPR